MIGINEFFLPAVIVTVVKLLLIPFYKSTDFDVHRNWLAITRHLDLSEWYFDNQNGETVHTLDYPPTFAFFEYILSNNVVTGYLLQEGYIDERCLASLPDANNQVSNNCVVFHRMTVIFADVIFVLGICALTMSLRGTIFQSERQMYRCVLMNISNAGLIILDHIHFQYNGMMLGILCLSLACLLHSMNVSDSKHVIWLELIGSILFSLLLTMKHLYIILGPVYFFYLLHRFCFTPAKENKEKKRFSIMRFLILGFAVASTLVLPFVPFIMQENPKEQMLQIFNRLFPFQRGLVHDYWAGNIWALYLFLEKILSFVARKMYPNKANQFAFPEIQPKHSVLLLFFSLIPACVRAWKAANSSSKSQKDGQDKLLACILYSAMSSFMLAYHVHEKAIMTAVIPMSFLAFFSIEYARLYLRLSAFGHFGLLPLLPRPHEVCVKFLLYICHLALSTWILSNHFSKRDGEKEEPATMLTKLDKLGLGLIIFQFLYSEFLHSVIFGKGVFEFLPLMMTSILCSMGLFYCWLRSFSMIL